MGESLVEISGGSLAVIRDGFVNGLSLMRFVLLPSCKGWAQLSEGLCMGQAKMGLAKEKRMKEGLQYPTGWVGSEFLQGHVS